MSNAISLFDATSKVFVTGALAANLRPILDQILEPAGVFELSDSETGLTGRDATARDHPLTAPPAGAVVLVAPNTEVSEVAAFTALWTDSALEAPEIIVADGLDHAAVALKTSSALTRALERELAITARDAVKLDRQIAILRDNLEDTRSALAEVRTMAEVHAPTAIESFARAPLGETLTLGAGGSIRQMLPFAGHMTRAVAVCLDAKSPRVDGKGVLEATLVAVEDGTTWGKWTIGTTEASGADHEWVTLAIDAEIPRRYRFLELVIKWRGLDGAQPVFRLASAAGDPRAALQGATDGSTPDRMLAMRVWTGKAYDPERRNDTVIFNDNLVPDNAGLVRVPVPRDAFNSVIKLSEAEPELQWCRSEGGGLFMHPAKAGPSVAALHLQMYPEIRGISTHLELAHQRAFPTEFSLMCSTFEMTAAEVIAAADPKAKPDSRVIVCQPWLELIGGSSKPLTLEFEEALSEVRVYFATRTTSGRIDFAHAWFRDVMAIR